jgi:hypothetical protein
MYIVDEAIDAKMWAIATEKDKHDYFRCGPLLLKSQEFFWYFKILEFAVELAKSYPLIAVQQN